jgi:hypothetical protein
VGVRWASVFGDVEGVGEGVIVGLHADLDDLHGSAVGAWIVRGFCL